MRQLPIRGLLVAAALVFLLFSSMLGQSALYVRLFSQGTYLKDAQQYGAAYLKYDSAMEAASKDKHWAGWAEARIKAGTCLGKEGKAIEAVNYFEATRSAMSEKFGPEEKDAFLLRLEISLGHYYQQLNAMDFAIRSHLATLELRERMHKGDDELAQSCLNIGAAMARKNDMAQAKPYLERGLKYAASNPAYQSKFWTNLGKVAQASGKADESTRAFREALRLRVLYAGSDPEEVAGAYLFLVSASLAAGQVDSAQVQLAKAARLLAKAPDAIDLWGDYYSLRSKLNVQAGRMEEALEDGKLALEYLSRDPYFSRSMAIQLIENGEIRMQTGDLAMAEADFTSALELFLPRYKDRGQPDALPELDSLQTEPWVIEALKGIADTYYLRYKRNPSAVAALSACLNALKLAVEQASIVRRALVSSEARLGLSGKVYQLYETAIVRACEMAEGSQRGSYYQDAFSFAEQGKAAVLLEEIALANQAGGAGLPSELRDSLDALELRYKVYSSTGFPNLADSILSELGELKIRLRQRYPSYFAARYRAQPVSIDTLRLRLRENEAVVEYFVGDENLVAFLITRDSFLVFRKELPANLNENIRGLRTSITSGGSSQALKDFRRLGRKLYLELVEDWAKKLPGETTSITIVPDGLLGYLPFEVLLTSDPGEKAYAELPYFIRRFRFSYAYSATLRYQHRPSVPVKKAQVLACALSFSGDATQTQRGSTDRENLAGLPYAIAEAKAIGDRFKGNFLLDDAATESAFRAQAPGYEILHLATHTIFNDSSPDATRIVFAAESEAHDGYLHAYELYGLSLHSDLAVLSACQTGDGELLRGEGVMSLGRAFTYAGCRSTVMTLWPLSDKASGAIMSDFYRHLSSGLPKDEALHRAKLDYLESQNGPGANPFYWAAFVQTGDASPVAQRSWMSDAYKYAPVGGVPIVLLIILLLFRRRARKARSAEKLHGSA